MPMPAVVEVTKMSTQEKARQHAAEQRQHEKNRLQAMIDRMKIRDAYHEQT